MKTYFFIFLLSVLGLNCFGAITKLDSLNTANDTLNKNEFRIRKNQLCLNLINASSFLNYTRIIYSIKRNYFGINLGCFTSLPGEGGSTDGFSVSAVYKNKTKAKIPFFHTALLSFGRINYLDIDFYRSVSNFMGTEYGFCYEKRIIAGVYTGIRKYFSEMDYFNTRNRIQPYVGVRLGFKF